MTTPEGDTGTTGTTGTTGLTGLAAAVEEVAALKWRGESNVALARLPALLDRARRAGDVEAEKRLRAEAVPNLLELGLPERAAAEGAALLVDPLVADDDRLRAGVGAMVADAWSRLGRVNAAMEALATAIGIARRLPTDTEMRVGAIHNVAVCTMQCGLFEAAEPLFDRMAAAIGPDFPLSLTAAFLGNRTMSHAAWGVTLEHIGRPDDAPPHYATALDILAVVLRRDPQGMDRSFVDGHRAFLEAKLGRGEAADAVLAGVDPHGVDTQTSLNHRMTWHLARAATDLATDRPRSAATAAERAAELAGRVHDRRWSAEAWRLLAAAERAAGDEAAAARADERARGLVDAVAWDDRVYGAALAAATAG